MQLYQARLVGYLSPEPGKTAMDTTYPPRFHWFLEALPKSESNAVEVHISEDSIHEVQNGRINRAQQRLHILRPESAVWIRYPPQGGNLSAKHFFKYSPAIALAYSWLNEDLGKVFKT